MTLLLPTTPRGSLLQNVSYVTKVTHYELLWRQKMLLWELTFGEKRSS